MKCLNSLEELREVMVMAAASGNEQARIDTLVDHFVYAPELIPAPVDPFTPVYRDAVAAIHAKISGRDDYKPARDELIPIDPVQRALRPGIYKDGGSRYLGMFLEAIGQILQIANTHAGDRVVEYGPGDGQIAIALARNGCDVAVVDVEEKYLEAIRRQGAAIGLNIDTLHGEFSHDFGLRNFDVAIFFEAFHHALDHAAMLDHLHRVLKPDGRIIFAGEPIIEPGSYWGEVVPFPWSVRLDALSLSAVINYGWMELGFQEGYFVELLMRSGWLVEKHLSTTNARGTCYVATKIQNGIDLSRNCLLQTWNEDTGWHGAEPKGRWTKEKAVLPLPLGVEHVTLSVSNPLPEAVRLRIAPDPHIHWILPGEKRNVRATNPDPRLVIHSEVVDLEKLTKGKDTRKVGIFVEKVAF